MNVRLFKNKNNKNKIDLQQFDMLCSYSNRVKLLKTYFVTSSIRLYGHTHTFFASVTITSYLAPDYSPSIKCIVNGRIVTSLITPAQ